MSESTTHWNDVGIDYDKVLNTDESNVKLLAAAVGLLPPDTKDLLDIGAGTGRLTSLVRKALPEATILGVDPAPTMVEAAEIKFADDPKVSFAGGLVEDLSFIPDNSFDAVISSFALHHLELDTYKLAAAELFRVLRPGGRFVNADQFCRVMGPAGSPERAKDVLDLLTAKAKHYLEHASFERMLLQIDLLPRFMREDGEILTTPEFWTEKLLSAGFAEAHIVETPPAELYNRVIWAVKPS
ncbi:class I SAM-dependent methyltransferase [Amycolatopsis sp. YIM 10]|uniref:class I SAM-dependent methyltransferase n=1 Tax=Amycolatopsis sp. YIM 10 TaxID=2653857 RepID=UPI0012907F41|nr:class I SAM-dependent methyltransferase [Amycolatopsis sp. YIM 10]QFU93317.1 23S rRNA (guanine(745)-N(1))-methyltransferase [Amycolatopsis sp. YIM 10]